MASVHDADQWLQVTMTEPYKFRRLLVQGRSDADMWVTSLEIHFDVGGGGGASLQTYTDALGASVSTRLHRQAHGGGILLSRGFIVKRLRGGAALVNATSVNMFKKKIDKYFKRSGYVLMWGTINYVQLC